jgi:outer membrane immunogenic protein
VLVLGIEGDLGFMDLKGHGLAPSSNPIYHQDLTLDGGLYGDITGRLGFAFDRVLVYGKGGWSYFDGSAAQTTTKPGYVTHATGAFSGAVYGGGVEYLLSPAISLKVEYLHFNFGTQGGDQTSVSDPPIGYVYKNRTDVDADTVKFGVNYRFN